MNNPNEYIQRVKLGDITYTITTDTLESIDIWIHEFAEVGLHDVIKKELPNHDYMLWQYAAWINHLLFPSLLRRTEITPDEYEKLLHKYVFLEK